MGGKPPKGPKEEEQVAVAVPEPFMGDDDSDVQDLQGSVRLAVKTQAQLLAETSELSVGTGTINDTNRAKGEDLDGNGIADSEEDDLGDLNFITQEDSIELADAFSDLSGNGRGRHGLDQVNRGKYNQMQSMTNEFHHALEWAKDQADKDPAVKALLDKYNETGAAEKTALDAAKAPGGLTADNFMALKQAEVDRNLAANEIVIAEAKAKGETAEYEQALKDREELKAYKDDMTRIQTRMEGKTDEQKQMILDRFGWRNQREDGGDFKSDWDRFKDGRLWQWEKQAGELKNVEGRHRRNQDMDYGGVCTRFDVPGEQPGGFSFWQSNPLSSTFSGWASPWSSSPAPAAPTAPTAPAASAPTDTTRQPSTTPSGPTR